MAFYGDSLWENVVGTLAEAELSWLGSEEALPAFEMCSQLVSFAQCAQFFITP